MASDSPSIWYDDDPDLKQLYQGDILDGVPVVITPPKDRRWVILRPKLSGMPHQLPGGLPKSLKADVDSAFPTAWSDPTGELVMAHASVEKVMIITQSCDIDWRKYCQVVPIYSVSQAPQTKLAELRANEIGSWFYLPATEGLAESYADLTHVTSVSTSYFRADHLVKRLSPRGMLELQNALSAFYARHFGFNIRDSSPQSALYGCASCFFAGTSHATTLTVEEGEQFPPCPYVEDLLCGLRSRRSERL